MNKSMNEVTAWLKALVHDGAHLRLDSRSVKPGAVFVAVPGLKADGRAFIRVAAARGAAGVLMETRNDALDAERFPIASLSVDDLSKHLGEVAAAFYGDPSSRMTGVAVTGTNGKTTTSYITRAILRKAGYKVGLIGTIQIMIEDEVLPIHNTTPDVVELHHALDRRASDELRHALRRHGHGGLQVRGRVLRHARAHDARRREPSGRLRRP